MRLCLLLLLLTQGCSAHRPDAKQPATSGAGWRLSGHRLDLFFEVVGGDRGIMMTLDPVQMSAEQCENLASNLEANGLEYPEIAGKKLRAMTYEDYRQEGYYDDTP
jgi:hypothetical protein